VSSTRRQLLARAAAAGGAAGRRARVDRVAGVEVRTDAEVLAALLRLERAAAYAYAYLLREVRFRRSTLALVREFAQHETAHVNAVEARLAQLPEPIPAAPVGLRAYERLLAELHVRGRLSHVRLERGALAYLIGLEMVSTGAWHDAVVVLAEPGALAAAAAIMACEAQHTAQLRILSHPGKLAAAAPVPFVTGRR
jgi:hypothetical protein